MERLGKVQGFLTREFPPPDKVLLEDEGGIIGYVISSRFDGMETRARIDIIWDTLSAGLTREELKSVVTVIPLTFAEERARTDGTDADLSECDRDTDSSAMQDQDGDSGELLEKTRSLLTNTFTPPDEVRLARFDDGAIYGTIMSPRFRGVDTLDRVYMILDIINQNLTTEERKKVLTIVATTPEEVFSRA